MKTVVGEKRDSKRYKGKNFHRKDQCDGGSDGKVYVVCLMYCNVMHSLEDQKQVFLYFFPFHSSLSSSLESCCLFNTVNKTDC